MAENKNFDEQTPADVLHTHAVQLSSWPAHTRTDEHEEAMNEIATHPNTSADTLKHLHNANMDNGKVKDEHHASTLFEHKNFPASAAEEFAQSAHNDPDYDSLVADASKVKGVSHDMFENIAQSKIDSGHDIPDFSSLRPEFYLKQLDKHPAGAAKDEETESRHSDVRQFALNGLAHTPHHTKETLDASVKHLTSNDYDPSDIEDFIKEREDLDSHHLDQLHSKYGEAGHKQWGSDISDYIAEHKNTDPALLAKLAIGTRKTGHNEKAMANPALPAETRKALIKKHAATKESSIVEGLTDNPATTPEELAQLHKQSDSDWVRTKLMSNEKFPAEKIAEHWESSDKKTDAARNMLKAPNLPTSVLKDLVMHSNQDVAAEALDHKNVDQSVLDVALKRRAPKINNLAKLHPLVIDQELEKGILENKISASKLFGEKSFRDGLARLSPEKQQKAIEHVSQRYLNVDNVKDAKEKLGEDFHGFMAAKTKLATSDQLPLSERNKHASVVVQHFKDAFPHNKEIENYSTPDDHKILKNAMEKMAAKGNSVAQKAVLSHPALLEAFDINRDKSIPGDFANAMLEKMIDYHNQGTTLMDSRGDQKPFLNTEKIKDLVRHPDTSAENVVKILDIPKYWEDQHPTTGSHTETVLDQKFKDLPEETKNDYYNRALNKANPNIDAALALSDHAPQEVWDTAWRRLGNEDKNNLAHEYHMADHLPDYEISHALDGTYNQEQTENRPNRYGSYGQKAEYNTLQQKVLASLDDSNHDRAAMHRFLQQQSTMDDDAIQRMSNEDIVKNMPEHFLQGASGEETLKQAATDENLQSRLAVKKLAADKMLPSSYEQKDKAKEKADNALASIKRWADNGTEAMLPEDANRKRIAFWHNFIADQDNKRSYYSEESSAKSMLANLKNGELDFLADFTGEGADDLKKEAIEKGLLTQGKVDQVMASGLPFKEVYSSMPTDKRKQFVQNLLNNPASVKPEHLDPILSHMNSSFLNMHAKEQNYGRTKAMQPEHVDEYVGNLQKMAQLISQHSATPQSDLSDFFRSVFENTEKTRRSTKTISGAPNNETLKKIAAKMVEHTDAGQFSDPMHKTQMKLAIYNALPEKLQGKNLLSSITKSAVAEKNVSVILDLMKKSPESPVLQKAISGIIAKPENLTLPQAVDAASLVKGRDITTDSAKRIVAALESKLAAIDPQSTDAQVAKLSLLDNTERALGSHQEGKTKFAIDTIRKYTTDENLAVRKRANTYLRQVVSKPAYMSFDERLSTYLSLSSNKEDFEGSTNMPDKEILNNSKTMEHSVAGWKLQNLVDHADVLNFGNAKILANRVMALKDAPDGRKLVHDTVQSLMHNDSVHDEDVTKLVRTMNRDELNAAMVEIKDQGSDADVLNTNAHLIINEALNRLERPLENESGYIDHKTINDLAYDMNNISALIRRSAFDEDAFNLKDKLAAQSDAIEKISKHAARITEFYSRPESRSALGLTDHAINVGYLHQIAGNILKSGRSFDREDALHIADIMAMPSKIATASGREELKDNKSFAENIKMWAAQAEGMGYEDWKAGFEANPAMSFSISHRPVIDTHILDALNPQKMLSHDARFARTEMSKWFSKMDDEALSKHGKNLLKEIMADKASMNADTLAKTLPYMRDKLSLKDIEGMLHDDSMRTDLLKASVAHNAGGSETLNAYLKAAAKKNEEGKHVISEADLTHACKSMHIDDKAAASIWKHIVGDENTVGAYSKESVIDSVLKNKFAPLSLVRDSVSWVQDPKVEKELGAGTVKELLSSAMENPSIPVDMYNKLFDATKNKYPKYFAAGGSFHPALSNSAHGGRLFRSLPVTVPSEVKHVDADKMAKAASANPPEKLVKKTKQIQEAMAAVPPEGINWVEFKRRAPALENIPEIKQLFMSKKNAPVMPEDFVRLQQNIDQSLKAKSFHLTYSKWDGMQTHNGGTNLVVQVNNSEESERQLAQDPKLWAFYQMLLRDGNNISVNSGEGRIGGHPTTPQLVSWGRVDTKSGKDGWIVEELQSDFSQRFRRNARSMLRNAPSGLKIDGHIISPEEVKKYLPMIEKAIEGHHAAALNSIIESAKAHGVKKLFVHGSGIRGDMSGRSMPKPDASPTERATAPSFLWFYDELPKSAGFKEVDYADYPNFSEERLAKAERNGTSTHCWALDLKKK